jgi:hypothetical protein
VHFSFLKFSSLHAPHSFCCLLLPAAAGRRKLPPAAAEPHF